MSHYSESLTKWFAKGCDEANFENSQYRVERSFKFKSVPQKIKPKNNCSETFWVWRYRKDIQSLKEEAKKWD